MGKLLRPPLPPHLRSRLRGWEPLLAGTRSARGPSGSAPGTCVGDDDDGTHIVLFILPFSASCPSLPRRRPPRSIHPPSYCSARNTALCIALLPRPPHSSLAPAAARTYSPASGRGRPTSPGSSPLRREGGRQRGAGCGV